MGGDDMSKLQEMEMAMGTGLSQDAISKAKQSKSERKARKVMFKLGLKPCQGECSVCWWALKGVVYWWGSVLVGGFN